MFCSSCGTSAVAGATFCASCGSRLPGEAVRTGAPETSLITTGWATNSESASFAARFGAYFIDFVLLLIGSLVVGFGLGVVMLAGADTSSAREEEDASNIIQLVSVAATFAYFWISASTGATIGMRMVGLAIQSEDGSRGLPAGRAFVRTIVFYLGSILLFIGWLWMLWDSDHETWHDKASGSRVVR